MRLQNSFSCVLVLSFLAFPSAALAEDFCGPNTGTCCDEDGNGSPGCNDLECCMFVCAVVPSCCVTSWDALCALIANDFCTVCGADLCEPGDEPDNDLCENAHNLGSLSIDTTHCAGSEGSATCDASTDRPDVWYSLTANCTGFVTADTGEDDFVTVLSVHTGCPGTKDNEIAACQASNL